MRKLILLLTLLLSISVSLTSFAQNNYVIRMKDLLLMPDLMAPPADTGKSYYKILFKMDTVALASRIYLLFGTDKDRGDVLMDSASVIRQGSQYKVSFSGKLYDVYYYSVAIPIGIPKILLPQMNYLTLYAESKEGVFSDKLYAPIKQ